MLTNDSLLAPDPNIPAYIAKKNNIKVNFHFAKSTLRNSPVLCGLECTVESV